MPANSKAMQAMMAIAEHEPEKLHARNRGVLKMTKAQVRDFLSGLMKGEPEHVKKKPSAKRQRDVGSHRWTKQQQRRA